MPDRDRLPDASDDYPAQRHAAYVVFVLFVVTLSSLLDRSLPALVVGPIRHAFGISNTQFSYLQGYAFAIVYSIAGLPLGRLVDRINRRNLILAGLIIWSISTASAVLATTYWEFFFTRMGVGIGEACLAPAAYSMIADSVPPARSARTISAYYISLVIGSGASLLIGGSILRYTPHAGVVLPFLGQTAQWQLAFLFAAAPALLLAPLMLTIREPVRRIAALKDDDESASFKAFLLYLARHRTVFLPLLASPALLAVIGYGTAAWAPTHYLRQFDIPTTTSGPIIGLLMAGAGVLGCLTSGTLSDRWLRESPPAARLKVIACAYGIILPSSIAWPLIGNPIFSYAIFAVSIFGATMAQAAAPSAIQDLVPNRMRGKAIALYMLISGLLGIGFGPTAAALLTDHVFHRDGALGLSLALVAAVMATLGGVCAVLALKPYARVQISMMHPDDVPAPQSISGEME